LLGIGIYGVTKLKAGAHLHDLFFPSSRIVRDYDWLEGRIGPLIPVEVVLRVPRETSTGDESAPGLLEKLQFIGRVHQSVAKVDGIGAAISAVNFCPPLPAEGTSVRQTIRRSILDERLQSSREQFIRMGLFRQTETEELWRISARAYAGEKVDYGVVLQDLGSAIGDILDDESTGWLGEVRPVICGGVPLVQKAQEQMLEDQIVSFAVALGLITPTMMVLLIAMSASEIWQAGLFGGANLVLQRSVAGALAMLPNIFPCVVVMGTMGLLGISLEIGSVMTASVAIGIAVDDTLHFLTWFRRGLNRGMPRQKAIEFAYRHCGDAMIQTAMICGLGLLVFAVSPFVPMARFGWLMFAMLSTAVLADLVIFSALLLTPLGRFYEPSRLRAPTPVGAWFPEPERSKS
jgi:predicted RND superfamily exporter protein